MGQIKLFFLLFLWTICMTAQKKTITHKDYDLWRRVTDVKISNSGKLIVSTIETSTKRGDGYVEIYNTQTKEKVSFFNGYKTSITFDENFVVFKKKPKYEVLRNEKKKKIKEEDQSKDMLFVYDVKNNLILDSIARVKKYKIPKEYNGWMIVEKFKNKQETKEKKKNKSDTTKHTAYMQNYALAYNFSTKKGDTIFKIKDFVIPSNGSRFYYSTTNMESNKDTKENNKAKQRDIALYAYDADSGKKVVLDKGKYLYENLSITKNGSDLAFIAATDSTSVDSLKFDLYHYHSNILHKRAMVNEVGIKKNWQLSREQSPFFSEDGNRLYFYSKPKVEFNTDTTLLEEEIPAVDVWSWKDKMIQPEQKSKLKELKKKAYISYFDIKNKKYISLQEEDIDELIFDRKKNQKYIIGANTSLYDVKRSWDYPRTKDIYTINTNTGEKKLALKNAALELFLSPNELYALYFDIHKQHWFSLHLETLQKVNLTQNLKVAFYDEDNDRPMLPFSYGFGGFDTNGYALVYDKFDIWKLSLDGKEKPINISENGRKTNVEYRTQNLDPDHKNLASYIKGELLVTSFNKNTKASGLLTFQGKKMIEKIQADTFFISSYLKAKSSDVLVYRKQNFNTYSDVYVSKNDLKTSTKITNANPQKEKFKWGSAELFSWTAYDGEKLDGIIYKPEDFDPSKKYPLITYFYEKRSDRLRSYHAPQPSASIVNPSYLVSNDYIMFVPDIVYQEGKPGPSAYNCIVSGVEAIEKLGYIDADNIAIQGQSWGGYQVAYLVTVTNKFKAAMAGAPVSNMTSAYGGIRWESGLSRAFQYEKTQSRIGKNLWEGFDLYIENSPLFGIPNIETPLLMMHNDKDGAVPYYQGIEMFMGMRRLQKPAWLLVYNDEAHNLKKVKNRQDLSIRMMQFFDHYLKGKPAPEWMIKGVPRIQKGKNFGYGTY